MKNIYKKILDILKMVFGYGIMAVLFLGGFTFFGYVAALIIGGDTASAICAFIYEDFISVIIYASTILVLLGIVIMYLSGQTALTTEKKKKE